MQPSPTGGRISLWAACSAASILVVAWFVLFCQPVSAQSTITVTTSADNLDNNGDCSLREAIESANRDVSVDACTAGSGADTIILPAGVYTITLAGESEDDNRSGDYDLIGSVQIEGAGANRSRIAAAELDRVFHVQGNAVVALTGLRIGGGLTPLTEPGGAILNGGELTIRRSVVEDSTTGGGQYCTPGDPCITEAGPGGGIANLKALTVTASIVQNNITGTDTDPMFILCPNAPGGGIYNRGQLRIVESEVTDNRSGEGGGIYNFGQTMIVSTTIGGNRTTSPGRCGFPYTLAPDGGPGGGLANANGTVKLDSSAVINNVTGDGGLGNRAPGGDGGPGGGIANNGLLLASNSTVAHNSTGNGGDAIGLDIWGGSRVGGSGGNGGGLYNTGTTMLNHVTIALNSTGERGYGSDGDGGDGVGSGIYNRGELSLRNTLVSDNHWTIGTPADCVGSIQVSLGYNVFSSSLCINTDMVGDRLSLAPQVGPLGNFGGPTGTVALLKSSLAVNGGDCRDSDGKPVTADQRGVPRPQGPRCDVGAYEFTADDPIFYLYLPFAARAEDQ